MRSQQTPSPAAKASGRKSAATAAKGQGNKEVTPGKHKRGKVVNGKKWCKRCSKWLAVEEFPIGSGQCHEDRRIIQNLRAAADAQGKNAWFKALMTGPEDKLQKKKVFCVKLWLCSPPFRRGGGTYLCEVL